MAAVVAGGNAAVMATTPHQPFVAPLPRRRLAWTLARIRVRRERRSLDERLAEGADPWESAELLLRAAELTAPAARRELADALDSVIAVAEHPVRVAPSVPYARVCPVPILAARDALAALAERLRDPAPVSAECVAMLATLLRRRTSPLYDSARAAAAVSDAVAHCSVALAPATPAGP